jgi:phosphoribosylaminoimidazolecarboxamide formyltransferase/IMP cyclohydrolase
MRKKSLAKDYTKIKEDHFPENMALVFGNNLVYEGSDTKVDFYGKEIQVAFYKKLTWSSKKSPQLKVGLRYGDNPDQEAALYVPFRGNLNLGGVKLLHPESLILGHLKDESLLSLGKHLGRTNLLDIDGGINTLKYLGREPLVCIMKHGNPCAVARGSSVYEAWQRAFSSDMISPFGGTVVTNKPLDKETAEAISSIYLEVVVAPEFESGSVDILSKRWPNLRILKVPQICEIHKFQRNRIIEFKTLSDGCLIPQWSYLPYIQTEEAEMVLLQSPEDLMKYGLIPKDVPERVYKDGRLKKTGKTASIERTPTKEEYYDLWFGWQVISNIISNSIIFVKDGATVAIAAGGQDRVGIARNAVFRAYISRQHYHSYRLHKVNFSELELMTEKGLKDPSLLEEIKEIVNKEKANLKAAAMISDAFFPKRDGIEIGLKQGVTSVIHPGGSLQGDYEGVIACNEYKSTMIFTGKRCFKH